MAPESRRAALLVGLVAALIYANALGNGFAYDDVAIIVEQERIHQLETLPEAIFDSYWPGGESASLWRPVTTAAFGVQWIIGGGAPLPFHVVNVLLHALTSMAVVLLLTHVLPLSGAFLGGIVFAVHPVHVEAVANVVGFAEIFSTLALLGALLLLVRAPRRVGWGTALGMGALYALAFGAKESAVTLPGLVFLVDAARGRMTAADLSGYVRDRWRPYLVMLVVAVGLLAARIPILGTIASPTGPMGASLLDEIPRIWTLADVWTHYVRLWVFPMDLSADYVPNVIPISLGWHASNLVGLVLALVILLGSLLAWRRPALAPGRGSWRVVGFGIVWFAVAVSPISNTLFLSGVLLAERTLYLPSVGLAAASGWMLVELVRHRRTVGRAVVGLVVVLSCVRTWTRTPTWQDSETVFLTMLAEQPHSGRSQWMLGDSFWMQGDTARALAAYRHAVNLLDRHYRLMTDVSRRLMSMDAFPSAERLLEMAWYEEPHRAVAPQLLAVARAEVGDVEGTERFARLALSRHELDPGRRHLLAWALAAQGRWEEAEEARRQADAQGRALMWQQWMYRAYDARRRSDSAELAMAVDSARSYARSLTGRRTLEEILMRDFGLTAVAPDGAPPTGAPLESADPVPAATEDAP